MFGPRVKSVWEPGPGDAAEAKDFAAAAFLFEESCVVNNLQVQGRAEKMKMKMRRKFFNNSKLQIYGWYGIGNRDGMIGGGCRAQIVFG